MILRMQGFPEEGELVLCTVTSVQVHSVFVELDEYGKGGMIHISEVSPGRIRNIRDFVKEGKKVVCKVLRINREKGYIDLSLRRVNESEKRRKIEDIKKEQNAEKIIEIAAEKLGIKTEELYKEISERIKGYASFHDFFEQAARDDALLENLDIDKKFLKVVKEVTKQRIKPTEVEIIGKLKITSFAPNGIEVIKDSLKNAEDAARGKIRINYLGSGMYRLMVNAPDYKEAERVMRNASQSAISYVAKHGGEVQFSRESA